MTVYEIVTERMIATLQTGVIPWRKPWGVRGLPRNLVTRKLYRGINVLLLASQAYGSAYWLTFKQVRALGGNVNKGQKATPIVFWQTGTRKVEDADTQEIERKRTFLLRYYNVFNVEQTTLANAAAQLEQDTPRPEPISACNAVVEGWTGRPALRLDDVSEDEAAYLAPRDTIVMPVMARFHSAEHYYATLFHELTHSTGHASRLNRPGITQFDRFGSEQYSKEELIAECGSAFLCGHAGISKPEIEQNAAGYVQHWIEVLKGDSMLVISAAAQAQRAVDSILNNEVAGVQDTPAALSEENAAASRRLAV